ncbi:MAG TPA: ATP-binding cassette domain-containing protein [Cellulomonadaceae bacterium]|nr:ATP-binding cassette domain-containing protein [Cellulomonadaceae bacterium]
MIEAHELSKRYGETLAVDRLTFAAAPGHVTGFLGPNGAGKSTTMRMILGLDAPTGGSVTVNGTAYREHRFPLHEVGALLEAKAIHPGRSSYNHLLAVAQSNGFGPRRVKQVLELVGLENVARRRAGQYSLGMGQRLGIATALLGDPGVLLLDEPVNGLDPEGIIWVRNLLKSLAAEGRTVFVSSHLMAEMALTADHLVVIGRGRLIADTSVAEFVARASGGRVRVSSPDAARLHQLLVDRSSDVGQVEAGHDGEAPTFTVAGLERSVIGDLALHHGIAIHELTSEKASLEQAFMELTADDVEFRAHGADQPAELPAAPVASHRKA